MNRLLQWSRNKSKKSIENCEADGIDGKNKVLEVVKSQEECPEKKREKILLIQWKEESNLENCLSQLSDDSAFSSSGCIVNEASLQLDSDSAKGYTHFNSSLDHEDLSDEDPHNMDISQDDKKRSSDEKSFSSISHTHNSNAHLNHAIESISNNSYRPAPREMLRSTSMEGERKKTRLKDRLRRISRLGLERNTVFVENMTTSETSTSSVDLEQSDILVSSSFSPKHDSLVEVVRVDPFMKARLLSLSGNFTPSFLPTLVLQLCSKNKEISLDKEFQKCLKKGSIKKTGKKNNYCFLFESFILLAKQKFSLIFQVKDIINLKLLWFTLKPNDPKEKEDEDYKKITLINHGKTSFEHVSETEVKRNVNGFQQKNDSKEYNFEFNDVKRKNTYDVNHGNNGNNKLSLTLGWINEKVNMKTLDFKSEEEKKDWVHAIKRQQETVCGSMEKSLIIKVQFYDKQYGTRTKKLEVGRHDTMAEVIGKFYGKNLSYMPISISDCSFGLKFVGEAVKYYLEGLESLYVLQMASDKGFLNGKIEYFSVTQARISSISKQINARRRKIKRTAKEDFCNDFLSYNLSKVALMKNRLFACNLQEMYTNNNKKLPVIIMMLLKLLNDKGPDTEGLFRKSHSQRELHDVVAKINSFKEPANKKELENISVHMAAAILKYWLMKLKECLMMSKYYFDWLEIEKIEEKEEKINAYKKVIEKLPESHSLMLKYLMNVLHKISQASAVNLMSSNNLAVCLGPSLLKPTSLVCLKQEKKSVENANHVVEFLIEKAGEIFGEVTEIEIIEDVEASHDNKIDRPEGDLMKSQSCENLDYGCKETNDDRIRYRTTSLSINSHTPLTKVVSNPEETITSFKYFSSEEKNESDPNLTETYKSNYTIYTDSTDESISEGIFSCGDSLVKKENIVNFCNDCIDGEIMNKDDNKPISSDNISNHDALSDGEEVKTPKIFTNKADDENSGKNIENERIEKSSQETTKVPVITKDGSISNDDDTLTKGSSNNAKLSTSEAIFTFPSQQIVKNLRSKSVTQEAPLLQDRTKILTNNFEKKIKESNVLKISKSFTKSSSQTNELKTFRENTVSAPKSYSLNHSSSLIHKKRMLPQIPEKNLHEKNNVSNVKLSLVEQQIQKFKESEQLLYNSVRKSKLAKPKPVQPSSFRSELINSPSKPTPQIIRNDSIPRPRYVVEVEVGKTCDRGKNFKALQNYMSLFQDSSSYNQRNDRKILSQSTADLNVYKNNYNDKDYSSSKNVIPQHSFKSNKENFLLYRSKTPNFHKSYIAHNDYLNKCRSPIFQQPYRNFSSLGFPIESDKMKKRHVTSIYVDSNDSPFTYSHNNHYFNKHNVPSYHSTFTLNL